MVRLKQAGFAIECAFGVANSGDSNATLPPFNLGEFVMQQNKKTIALGLSTVGLINIQFAIKDEIVIYY
jgi:hypothetical protein